MRNFMTENCEKLRLSLIIIYRYLILCRKGVGGMKHDYSGCINYALSIAFQQDIAMDSCMKA